MLRRIAALTAMMLAASPVLAAGLNYPAAPRGTVTDTFFGTSVADPYRWMEDIDAPQTTAWVKAEGDLTRAYLDAIPQRAAIRDDYRKLLDYEKVSAPFREGKRWFFSRNSGLQNQSVLYVRDCEKCAARVFLDPNTLAKDGTVALGGIAFTHDGSRLAYATQSSGSDWQTWHVRDVATDRDLPDVLEWSKFSGATWDGNDGFYYIAYDTPTTANTTFQQLGAQKIRYHTVGTPQSADRLVYDLSATPDRFAFVRGTEDQRYIFRGAGKGGGADLWWKRRGEPDSAFRQALPFIENVRFSPIGNDGSRLYLVTNENAPKSKVVWIDLDDPQHVRHDLVPEAADALEGVTLIGNTFYVGYLHDAHSVVRRYTTAGKPAGEIALPGIGSGGIPGARREDRIAYYGFTSYTFPTTIYRYDTLTGKSTVAIQPKIAFNPTPYTTDLLFATSKDGTKVPVFLTHRKGMAPDGMTPTMMYGYGGFQVNETPGFESSVAQWLSMGGAYADVVLRGGTEYGEAWHEAGRLGNKQHVFDDFIAAAEMLESRKVTSPKKLAILGGSNGGLLVGAVEEQRPELFGAAVPAVGVMDMLRFPRFTVGKAWVPEYGDASASDAAFRWLYAYSPVHNVKDGTAYPPTLVMTSDHDDRVFPAHSFKFAAAMQHGQAGDAPILLRVETKSGHGGGRPTEKIIDEQADVFAFLVKSLNFTPTL